MGYQKQAFWGLSWVGLFRAFLRGSAFIRTIILARILSPHDFGLFGIVAVFLGLLEMFTETGVNVILVQEDKTYLGRYLNTAFTVSIVRGILIFFVLLTSIPLVLNFYHQPALLPLMLVIAFVPLIRGFLNPAIAKFQQELTFNREFFFKAMVILVDTLTAIITASIYQSALGIVLGLLAGAIAELILSHLIKPRPQLAFDWAQFRHLFSRGKWVTLSGISAYASAKIPDLSISKLLTPDSLGYYQMAYRFLVMPIDEIFEIFNRVTFPVYRRIAHDPARLWRAFYRNFLVIIALSGLSLSFIQFLFPRFVVPLLGLNWLPITSLSPPLLFLAVLIVLSAPVNPLYLAVKKQEYLTLTTITQFAAIALFIFPLTLNQGLSGAISAYIISLIFSLPIRWYLAYRCLFKLT